MMKKGVLTLSVIKDFQNTCMDANTFVLFVCLFVCLIVCLIVCFSKYCFQIQ